MNASDRKKYFQRLLQLEKEHYNSARCALHTVGRCSEPAINSHSISAVNLRLLEVDNHLKRMRFNPFTDELEETVEIKSIATRTASCFKGFCAEHDNLLFREIDAKSFELTKENINLYFLRSCFQEISVKTSVIHCHRVALQELGMQNDAHVEFIAGMIHGNLLAIRDLHTVIDNCECEPSSSEYKELKHLVIKFDRILPYAYLAPLNFELFQEYEVPQADLEEFANSAMCGLIPMESGSAFIVCWHKGYEKKLNSFLVRLKSAKSNLAEFLFQFGVESFENLYFQPSWVDSWSEQFRSNTVGVFRGSTVNPIPNLEWRPFRQQFPQIYCNPRLITKSPKVKMLWRKRS